MGGKQSFNTREARDPYTGLTKAQYLVLRRMWVEVEAKLPKHALALFVRFFETHSRYKALFRQTEDGMEEELTGIAINARCQSTLRSILLYFGTLLKDSVERPGNMEKHFEYLALIHRKLPIDGGDFKVLKDVMLDYFKMNVITSMTPDVLHIWKTFFAHVFENIVLALNDVRNEKPPLILSFDADTKQKIESEQLKKQEEAEDKYFRRRKDKLQHETSPIDIIEKPKTVSGRKSVVILDGVSQIHVVTPSVSTLLSKSSKSTSSLYLRGMQMQRGSKDSVGSTGSSTAFLQRERAMDSYYRARQCTLHIQLYDKHYRNKCNCCLT